jgi:transmembrane sensor
MTPQRQHRIFRQAVEWFVQLESERCDEQQRDRFQDWLSENEAHQRAYAEAERLWANLDNLKDTNIPELHGAGGIRPLTGRLMRTGLSALLLAVLVSGWWQDYSAETITYSTSLGERRRIYLPDGSQLALNAATRLSVRLSWLRRQVELEEGEVLVTVAHQNLRPFTVQMADLRIKDIGTVFNVRKRPEGGAVSVLEGEVELKTDRSWFGDSLKAGFSRRIDRDGRLRPVEKADIERSTAWTEGHLIFDHTPLADVAAELERHHAVHFVFADPSIAGQTLSGSFDTADLKPFLLAVEKILPIHAKRQKQTIVLSNR